MAMHIFHIVLVVLLFITLTSSKELLKALYESDDPLLLDEEKSRQIADSLEKRKTSPTKVGSGKGRQQFFAQIGYDDDYYGNPPNKFDDTKSPIIENPQKAQRYKDTKTNQREPIIKQGQQNIVHTKDKSECPDDVPTYRTFEGSKCIPIHPNDQNTQTANQDETFIEAPEKPKDPSTSHHLINYLQLDTDHGHQHRYGYKHRHYKPKGQKNGLEPDRQITLEKETGRYKAGDTSYNSMTSGQKQEPITNQQTRPYWGNNVDNQQYDYQRESERQQNVYGQQSYQQPGRYEQQTHRNNYEQPSQGQSQSQTQTDAQSGVIVDYANEVDSMDSYWSQNRGDQKAINPEISSRPEGSRTHQYGYQRESERQQNVHGPQSNFGSQQQTERYGQQTHENNYQGQSQSQSQTQTNVQLGLPVDYANEVDSMDSYWSQNRGDQKPINPEISSRPENSRTHQYGYQRESESQQNVLGQHSNFGNQQQTGHYGQQTHQNNYQQPSQGQSQTQTDAQLGLPVDYANEVDSMDSYWSQDRGDQKAINPPSGSQNSRNPKQKIPTSVNTQKLSSHREQNTIDVNQNQLYPIIGHRPWPLDYTIDQKPGQVPLDNTIDQQQVNTPLIPHYQKGTLSCVGKDSGFYTDYASDCRRFYRCIRGDPRVFTFQCGLGTKFHSTLYQCVHEAQVDCKEQTYQLPGMK